LLGLDINTVAIIGGGLFALLKWLHEVREKRIAKEYDAYQKLLDTISQSPQPHLLNHIAAIRMLGTFKRYKHISIAALEAFESMTCWHSDRKDELRPHVNATLKELI
jgi:hypothetical protein